MAKVALAMFLLPITMLADPGDCIWSTNVGGTVAGTDGVLAYSIATDSGGSVVSVGTFKGTVNFGSGSRTAHQQDLFILKHDSSGGFLWATNFGGTGNDFAYGVAVDTLSNIIVVGTFEATVDFGVSTVTNIGGLDSFIVKLSPAGIPTWAKHFGGAGNDRLVSVATDSNDNIYVCGASGGVFLAKLSSDGNFLWTTNTVGGILANSITVDATGDPIIAGFFSLSMTIGADTLTSAGGFDGFVAKFSGVDGTAKWSLRGGGAGNDHFYGVAVDVGGNVYATGDFTGTANFGGSDMTATYNSGVVVAKYSPIKTHLWSRGFSSVSFTGSGVGYSIAAGSTGDAYVAGSVQGGVDFDGNFLGTGSTDILLAELSRTNGVTLWAKSYGGIQSDIAYGVTAGSGNTLLAAGQFVVSADFGCGALQSATAVFASGDMFVAKCATVAESGLPPQITQQPTGVTNYSGTSLSLSVIAN